MLSLGDQLYTRKICLFLSRETIMMSDTKEFTVLTPAHHFINNMMNWLIVPSSKSISEQHTSALGIQHKLDYYYQGASDQQHLLLHVRWVRYSIVCESGWGRNRLLFFFPHVDQSSWVWLLAMTRQRIRHANLMTHFVFKGPASGDRLFISRGRNIDGRCPCIPFFHQMSVKTFHLCFYWICPAGHSSVHILCSHPNFLHLGEKYQQFGIKHSSILL